MKAQRADPIVSEGYEFGFPKSEIKEEKSISAYIRAEIEFSGYKTFTNASEIQLKDELYIAIKNYSLFAHRYLLRYEFSECNC